MKALEKALPMAEPILTTLYDLEDTANATVLLKLIWVGDISTDNCLENFYFNGWIIMINKIKSIRTSARIGLIFIFILTLPISLKAYIASDFHWRPPFTMANEIPSITILLDSSDAMHRMAYAKVSEPNSDIPDVYENYGFYYDNSTATSYIGYFKNDQWYKYNNNTDAGYFEEVDGYDASATYEQFYGKFMNWATMHRLDVARKILTGGSYNATTQTFEIIVTDAVKDQYSTDPLKKVTGNSRPVESTKLYTPYAGYIVQIPGKDYINFYDLDPNKKTNAKVISNINYRLRIKNTDITRTYEDGKWVAHLTGILDKYVGKARFALARYFIRDEDNNGIHDDTSNTHKGAMMLVYMDQDGNSTIETIKKEINKIWPSSKAAPLAEAIFTVAGYVMQKSSTDIDTGPKYESEAFDTSNTENDPYYFEKYKNLVSCTQQNIILITPGESAFGDSIPIGDGKTVSKLPFYPSDYGDELVNNGKYYIQDTSHWMHTNDLRDLNGTQNIDLFVVRSFGVENTEQLLKDAAMYGSFKDRNNDNLPVNCTGSNITNKGICSDTQFEYNEFDNNDDDIPDNYFAANNDKTGEGLQKAMIAAFEAATRRVTSGTAAAVTSQTRSGEGAVYQALFFPPTDADSSPIAPPWSGQVHAMLVDSNGTIHEDTDGDHKLTENDASIVFAGEQIFRYYATNQTTEELNNIQQIKFLWSSTEKLNSISDTNAANQRYPYNSTALNRYIFTFQDIDNNGLADPSSEIKMFTNSTCDITKQSNYCNYLTLFESTSGDLGQSGESKYSPNTLQELAKRQVDYVRGVDVPNTLSDGTSDPVRSRKLNSPTTWRLGDIVYSSPTIVGAPSENYHTIYQDGTYRNFYNKYKNRRQVLYVGANDGMLHAFNAGFYNSTSKGFDESHNGEASFELGAELWAYVPYNILPHLRWLMNPDYGGSLHVPYMDLKPRVFDARIFIGHDEAIYPSGWGTILVAGMRFGGAEIKVDAGIDKTQDPDDIRTMSSAYVILDITNPEAPPNLLGEIRMPRLGFTTCYPTVMPMSTQNINSPTISQNQWYLVFGSGPASATGSASVFSPDYRKPAVSEQQGQLYVLDLMALAKLETGTRAIVTIGDIGGTKKVFSTTTDFKNQSENDHPAFAKTEPASFIGDPIAVDLDIGAFPTDNSFKTDVTYFGSVTNDGVYPSGKMWRMTTGNILASNLNSGTSVNWANSTLIDVQLPISTAPAAAVDNHNKLWIYFGTGRFYNRDDISQTKAMSFFGVKEPTHSNGTYSWKPVETSTLFDSTGITLRSVESIYSRETVLAYNKSGSLIGNWSDLENTAASYHGGWRRDFSEPWERVLGQPAILGGAVLFTTYIPDTDICEPEGLSRLYGLYYKTGTAYYEPILGALGDTINTFVGLGKGLAITPSLHVGDKGVTAYIQTSSGAIETIELETPITVKSGTLFWRKNSN